MVFGSGFVTSLLLLGCNDVRHIWKISKERTQHPQKINTKRLRPTIGGAFCNTMSRTPSTVSTLDPTTTTFTLRHQGKVFTCCSSGLQKEQSNLSPKGFHPCPKTMLGKEVTIQSVETVPRLLQISPRWQSTVVILCHTNRTAVFRGCVSRRKFWIQPRKMGKIVQASSSAPLLPCCQKKGKKSWKTLRWWTTKK